MARHMRRQNTAKVYPGGQVWFGKWLSDEGYAGEVQVVRTPTMVLLLRPGVPRHELVNGLRTVVREIENDDRFRELASGGDHGNGPEIDGLDFVLRRLTQMSSEVDVVRKEALRRHAELGPAP